LKNTKVKSVLVCQPKPETEKSPYFDLAKKHGLKIDFRPFIEVKALTPKEFRAQKINILEHTAIILNSRNSVDNFFRVCTELKIEMPIEMKYFCVNESIANYLSKYIQVRKRKIFVGKGTETQLFPLFKTHAKDKFLFACSDWRKQDIEKFMKKSKIAFKEAFFYRIISSNLQDLSNVNYDIISFFSPADIRSLFENFPEFKQNNTVIAAWGATTIKAIIDEKLTANIQAPTPETPSMVAAIDKFIIEINKEK
jgi:uroporphyrinogen-III synthase